MFPAECSIAEAAEIHNVDPSTVRKWIAAGQIRVRDIAPPGSSRKRLRLLRDDVEALRNGHAAALPECERKRREYTRRVYQPTILRK